MKNRPRRVVAKRNLIYSCLIANSLGRQVPAVPYYFFACFMLTASLILAQSTYELGALPAISINKKLPEKWEVNFKTEQRFRFSSGTFSEGSDRQADYILSDYSLLVAKKTGLSSKLNGGYLIRFRNGRVFHRSIQQFTAVRRLSNLRLAHRLASDQTYVLDRSPTFRIRYRIGTELPLSGQSADTKEWYLKLTNEYLNIFQSTDYDLEIRLVALTGYTVNSKSKVEFGFDYRIDSFLDTLPEHVLRASINWYYSI